jgi:hypothetical protein
MEIKKTEAGLYSCEIDGFVYEWTKWQTEDSVDSLLDLGKICGKPIAMVVEAIFTGSADKEVPTNLLGQAAECLMSGLGDKVLVKALLRKFSSGEKVFCNGAKINYNTHYQDRLFHLGKVVHAGLEVQYGNFTVAVLGIMGLKLPKMAINPPPTM